MYILSLQLSSKHHHSSHHCVKCIKTHSAAQSSGANVNAISTNLTGSLPNPSGSITSSSSSSLSSSSSTSTSSPCAYGECNGHYVSKSQTTKTYPCCQPDLATSSSASHHHHHHQVVDERKVCQCRYRIHSETGEREPTTPLCQKCSTEMDNIKTKSKLDQLRLVMQQRKQKREARKLKGAPYGARVVGTTTTATAAAAGVVDSAATTLPASNTPISANNSQPISVASTATTPSEVSPNHIVEEVDTAA